MSLPFFLPWLRVNLLVRSLTLESLDEAVRHGAADLDYSAVVATILPTAAPTASPA